ncbi:B12-binding domain-containing protein [Rhizobium sp. G21]|nr:B12-binding domain-containing protein [Rhizobium sp. G21]
MVAWPQSRDLFRAPAEFAEAQRSDDEHLGIDDLVRLVMLRRLDAAATGEIGAEASDAAALDRALDRIEGRERGGRERIEETLELARALDIDGVRRKLWICSNEFDIGDFVLLYALPLMRRVGDLWASNQISVAAEHLVSSALVSLLRSGAAPGHPAAPVRLKMLVATPFGELHEIGALAGLPSGAEPRLRPALYGRAVAGLRDRPARQTKPHQGDRSGRKFGGDRSADAAVAPVGRNRGDRQHHLHWRRRLW